LLILAFLAFSCSLLFGFPALSLFHTLCRSVYHRCRRAPLHAFISFLLDSESPNTIHNMQVQA
jgi:hypothetical protein